MILERKFLNIKCVFWFPLKHLCDTFLIARRNERDVNKNVQGDTKKRELLKKPTKIEEIREKNLLTELEPLQLAF